MPTSTYSLSSATTSAGTTRPRRVSAQSLARFMGSRSRQHPRSRGLSEDGMCTGRSNTRKAAAWMWHSRGIGQAAVLPTNASCSRRHEASTHEIHYSRKQQPSRFKAEADKLESAPTDPWRIYSCPSAYDQNHESQESQDVTSPYSRATPHATLDGKLHEQPPSNFSSTFLYDDFELSRLQHLLKRESDIKHPTPQQRVSHDVPIYRCTSSSHRQSKPFSAIHKLFKRLYTTLHNRTHTSATDAGPPGRFGPRKPGSMQHVIHHLHHHHHHHYNRSLDLPAHESQPVAAQDLQGFVRRRRAQSESCNEAWRLHNVVELDVVDDSLYAAVLDHRPQRIRAPE